MGNTSAGPSTPNDQPMLSVFGDEFLAYGPGNKNLDTTLRRDFAVMMPSTVSPEFGQQRRQVGGLVDLRQRPGGWLQEPLRSSDQFQSADQSDTLGANNSEVAQAQIGAEEGQG